jgi:prepilin-type N-terminal cleavage/methylation domain-containing protein
MASLTRQKAFTLIELLIAVALMLVLMIGVHRLFAMVADAIGTSQAISSAVRDTQSAQTIMTYDVQHMATIDAPCILLRSEATPAFRSATDEKADRDYSVSANSTARDDAKLTIDIDGNNTEGELTVAGEMVKPANYNNRNHRTDIFSFFARGAFSRQTGGGVIPSTGVSYQPMVSQMNTNEAWIWYGHLKLADNAGGFNSTNPGSGTFASNPNNFYASQWVLGRIQMCLKEPTQITGSSASPVYHVAIPERMPDGTIKTVEQDCYTGSTGAEAPLSFNSGNTRSSAKATHSDGSAINIQDCRYDLACTSISAFRLKLTQLMLASAPTQDWWDSLMLYNTSSAQSPERFQCNPFVLRPLNAETYSQQYPLFLRGCSQFMVEYAGDFLNQNPITGAVLNDYCDAKSSPTAPLPTDGQIDFVMVGTAPNQVRQIRWYGLPRDVDGDGQILLTKSSAVPNTGDVLPLRDLWTTSPIDCGLLAPFERSAPGQGTDLLKAAAQTNYMQTMARGAAYTCAWGPADKKPSMFRIHITVDDPAGRTSDGSTFEYVFKVQ